MALPAIRPMESTDLDSIMPLERMVFSDPWTRAMYASDLKSNNLATYLVVTPVDAEAEALPPVLAWGGFWLLVNEAHIATIASHPDWRGCGLGLWVMLGLLDAAEARGADIATLEVRASNVSAQRLYEKLGFAVVGRRRRYYRDGEDGLIMTTRPLEDARQQKHLHDAYRAALEKLTSCFDNRQQRPADGKRKAPGAPAKTGASA